MESTHPANQRLVPCLAHQNGRVSAPHWSETDGIVAVVQKAPEAREPAASARNPKRRRPGGPATSKSAFWIQFP
jgi:hypothetical protein